MKKSLLVLATVIAIPALLSGCSKKPAADNTPAPSSSEAQQDPHQVLAGFEEATDLAIDADWTGDLTLEANTVTKFKVHFQEGEGHGFLLEFGTYGSAISASDNVQVRYLDYKGDVVSRVGNNAWGMDGYYYMEITKGEATANPSKITIARIKRISKKVPVSADESAYLSLSDPIAAYKSLYYSFEITEANKNYAIAFTGTGDAYTNSTRTIYGPDLASVELDSSYATKFKYNFIAPTAGWYYIKFNNSQNQTGTIGTGLIVQIDRAA